MPDLQRADPRQGISRRSCMLMRRILLEVGRGLRTRVRQLGSCFHPPGAADQADSNIPCPMRFLYYVMNSSNQHHHSNVLRSWIPHLEQPIKQTRTFRVQCVFYVGTVFTNLIRISVVANVHLRTYASSGFCPRQGLGQRKSLGPSTVNHSNVPTCARPGWTPKLFLLSSVERH